MMNITTAGIIVMLSFLLSAADGGGGTADERENLETLQRSLRARIETLSSEQDFLLFQKEMCVSDSKYLLLNVPAKTGQLKYKNRVLMDFPFLLSGNISGNMMRTGMLALAKKTEGKNGRHTLKFGNAFILQWKRAVVPPDEQDIPAIALKKRDLQSVFYAVEPGALAYVIW